VFNSTCYDWSSVKLLIYGESSKVISYENGTKIKKYAECESGKLYENLENKSYSWDIPFFTYPNCDNKYDNENHTIALRVCKPSGENYYEEALEIEFTGHNSTKCPENEIVVEPEVTDSQTTEPETDLGSVNNGTVISNESTIKTDIVYEPTTKKNLKIAIYLLGGLLALLIIYLILNKKV